VATVTKRGDKWYVYYRDANKTINRRVSSVQAFLRHLSEVGGVTEYSLNRYAKLPTGGIHRKRRSRALSEVEAGKLMNETADAGRRRLYTLVLRSGLRMLECRQMQVKHFDIEHKQLHVPAHISKAKRDQTIPLHPTLLKLIPEWSKGMNQDDVLFPMPLKRHVIDRLRDDCKALDIDPQDVGFHSLRHTYCTMLARANVHPALLQKLARHADVKTTLGYYVHLQRSDEADAIAKLP
jgi:integrase